MPDVVIGVGTNLGDRLGHLRQAVRALRAGQPSLHVRDVSPIYEAEAQLPPEAPGDWQQPYLNLAVRADWSGDPVGLLEWLKREEVALGRRHAARWSPREIDLDLLVFDHLMVDEAGLRVPHPSLPDRPFALLPLGDVAPDWRFPPGHRLAGRSSTEVAARWRSDPDAVPFRTRRTFDSLTQVVGIVNLTADSFSDGGDYSTEQSAVAHARGLVRQGAAVIDLGAESTRPGARPVAPMEEWARLEGVLGTLSGQPGVCISVDTRHAPTARLAIAAGARWINDVDGLQNPEMVDAVAESDVDVVLMHSLSVPPSRTETLPPDRDPLAAVRTWADERLAGLHARGVSSGRVILDPGIGFGKTPHQNVELLRRAHELTTLGVRVLVGHSRKAFLASWFAPDTEGTRHPATRDLETAILSAHLARQGVDYVRVHNVGMTVRALRAEAFAA